ncbi:MAG: hypothetical protein IKN63_02760 [Bacilli bacterium]|nr:hypothetical protein [Bacilli bacterium]
MKKKILLLITILILTCACSSSNLKSLNLKSLEKKLNDKETFILYLTDESDGKTLKNTLSKVSKDKDITAFYLNTIKLNEKDLKSLKEKFTFEDTNIILFIKNGKEETTLSRIDDIYISEKDLAQELINQGYIK